MDIRALFISAIFFLSFISQASECDDLARKAAFNSSEMTDEDRAALLRCSDESDSEVDGFGFASPHDLQRFVDQRDLQESSRQLQSNQEVNASSNQAGVQDTDFIVPTALSESEMSAPIVSAPNSGVVVVSEPFKSKEAMHIEPVGVIGEFRAKNLVSTPQSQSRVESPKATPITPVARPVQTAEPISIVSTPRPQNAEPISIVNTPRPQNVHIGSVPIHTGVISGSTATIHSH